jgi:hypothetical protein
VSDRGTTNGNARGGSAQRRRRREWLVTTFRANVDLPRPEVNAPPRTAEGAERFFYIVDVPLNRGIAACRCYRCGALLTVDTVTVDRIIPGCKGGTYRRNNIRPACGSCNSETGGGLRSGKH